MKRLSVLLVMLLLVSGALVAQISQYYNFTATTGTYTPITGTSVPACQVDDGLSGAIPVGFTFMYGTTPVTQVYICSNGFIGLASTVTESYTNLLANPSPYCPVVAPFLDDLTCATATVSYLTEGTAPNRIFTVQYANFAFNYTGTTRQTCRQNSMKPVKWNLCTHSHRNSCITFCLHRYEYAARRKHLVLQCNPRCHCYSFNYCRKQHHRSYSCLRYNLRLYTSCSCSQ